MTACAAVIAIGATVGIVSARGGDSPSLPTGPALLIDLNQRIASDPNRAKAIGELSILDDNVYAIARNDPVDVDLLAGSGAMRCLSVSGDGYPSSASCFDVGRAAVEGSYQVVIPLDSSLPTLVVGVAPTSRPRVAVTAGGARSDAERRDGVFLASLNRNAIPSDPSEVTVEYSSQ
jgi:hypothetical protein